MKYLKIFFSFTVAFLLCALVSTNVSAEEIDEEVTTQATASTDESWKMILDHLDIDIEYLEPNKYLGLYWDSFIMVNQQMVIYTYAGLVNITLILQIPFYSLKNQEVPIPYIQIQRKWITRKETGYHHFINNILTII